MPVLSPITFKEAARYVGQKKLLATTLSAKELKQIRAEIRERAFFSAKVANAQIVGEMAKWIEKAINPTEKGGADYATIRAKLKEELKSLGVPVPEVGKGGVTKLGSDARLNLIIRTQTEMARGFGHWKRSQDALILRLYPAQELFRAEDRAEPRDWPKIWAENGGQFFEGNSDYPEGRMIALKNDPIWEAISYFGQPYPPFHFNSGMNVRSIKRSEAIELGLLTGGDDDPQIEPQARSFEADTEASTEGLPEDIKEQLLEDLGDGYGFDDDETLVKNRRETIYSLGYLLNNSGCGAGEPGAPGFQPGNTCAAGAGAGGGMPSGPKEKKKVMEKLKPGEWPDTSDFGPGSSAKWAKNKIAYFQKLVEEGKAQEIAEFKLGATTSLNSYQKAVLHAQKIAAEKVKEKFSQPLSQLATPPPKVSPPAAEKQAESVVPSEKVLKFSSTNMIGQQLGSNKGGSFIGPDGQKYYVKQGKSKLHVENELLAAKLYEAAGSPIVKYSKAELDGQPATATKWQEGQPLQKNMPSWEAAKEDFYTHAWLSNWDAVGMTYDNLKIIDGKPTLVDAGGSLLFRAQGAPKGEAFHEKGVPELATLVDPTKNPTSAAVFSDMTHAQKLASVKKVTKITDEEIDQAVNSTISDSKVADKLRNALKARRDSLKIIEEVEAHAIKEEQQAAQAKLHAENLAKEKAEAEVKSAEDSAKAMIKEEVKSAGTTETIDLTPPTQTWGNPLYVKKALAAFEAAKNGDIAAIEAIKSTSKVWYDKKLTVYKQELIDAIKSGKQIVGEQLGVKATQKQDTGEAKTVIPTVIPKPPEFISKQYGAENTAKAKELYEMALAGKLKEIKAYVPGKSPKLQQYQESLIDAFENVSASEQLFKKLGDDFWQEHSKSDIGMFLIYNKTEALASKVMDNHKWLSPFETVKTFNSKDTFHKSDQLGVTKSEQQAITTYTGGSYLQINSALRSFKPTKQAKDAANAAVKLAVPIGEVSLARRMSLGPEAIAKLKALKPGTTLVEPGLSSTSTNPEGAMGGKVIIQMIPRSTAKGVFARNFSMHSSENEVILPPFARYTIMKVEEKGSFVYVQALVDTKNDTLL